MNQAINAPRSYSPSRTYVLRTVGFMLFYVLVSVLAIAGLFDSLIGGPGGWVIAVAVAVPVAAQVWATLRLMADSDEFVRVIVTKCFVLTAGTSMVLWTIWGFGEAYAGAPHLDGWLIYPCFWAAYALVPPFVRTSKL